MAARPRLARGVPIAWEMVAAIFVLTLACYGPVLHGAFLWDDEFHVTSPKLAPWSGLVQIWTNLRATKQYYPVLHTAFWVEHRLWQDSPLGYHLVNVLLHATSACLLALVIRRLWAGAAPVAGKPSVMPAGADWLAAALFALHPVGVETVAWISEQKNTLSLVFYLLSALAYLRFARERSPGWYALAFGLFALALASKSVTATLPGALLVARWWQQGRLTGRRDVRPLVPWFLASAAAGIFTAWVERTYIGAEGPAFALTAGQRILLAARDVWFYLGKLAWPRELVFTYPRWNVPLESPGWYGYLAGFLLLTTALAVWRRRVPGACAGWLVFVGSLFPVLGFVNVYPFVFSYVADHFQYVACLGIFVAVAGAAAQALARRPLTLRTLGWGAFALVLAALAVETHAQSLAYRDSETLYRRTLAQNPDSWMAHDNLGRILVDQGDLDTAIGHYRRALQLYPDFAGIHGNLGVALIKKGEVDEARAQLEQATALDPYDASDHDNLGTALRRLGRLPESLAQYELALAIDPDDASARFNYALALLNDHRPAAAAVQYQAILAAQPGNLEAHLRLGNILMQSGDPEGARIHFQAAAALDAGNADAETGLGAAYLSKGKVGEALLHFRAAVANRPDDLGPRNNLGVALLRAGQADAAAQQFEEALKIDPTDSEARFGLETARRGSPAAHPQ